MGQCPPGICGFGPERCGPGQASMPVVAGESEVFCACGLSPARAYLADRPACASVGFRRARAVRGGSLTSTSDSAPDVDHGERRSTHPGLWPTGCPVCLPPVKADAQAGAHAPRRTPRVEQIDPPRRARDAHPGSQRSTHLPARGTPGIPAPSPHPTPGRGATAGEANPPPHPRAGRAGAGYRGAGACLGWPLSFTCWRWGRAGIPGVLGVQGIPLVVGSTSVRDRSPL